MIFYFSFMRLVSAIFCFKFLLKSNFCLILLVIFLIMYLFQQIKIFWLLFLVLFNKSIYIYLIYSSINSKFLRCLFKIMNKVMILPFSLKNILSIWFKMCCACRRSMVHVFGKTILLRCVIVCNTTICMMNVHCTNDGYIDDHVLYNQKFSLRI